MSAVVAQLLSDQASYVNSSYTVVVDFVVFYSTFSVLFYLDNRKKYRLESGELDRPRIKKDLIKIISSLGVAEIVYTAARWALQYYFLNLEYEAYLASIIAHVISTILYMIVVNVSVKITRLYKDGT
jgi:Na+-driven multidrug efflux pump